MAATRGWLGDDQLLFFIPLHSPYVVLLHYSYSYSLPDLLWPVALGHLFCRQYVSFTNPSPLSSQFSNPSLLPTLPIPKYHPTFLSPTHSNSTSYSPPSLFFPPSPSHPPLIISYFPINPPPPTHNNQYNITFNHPPKTTTKTQHLTTLPYPHKSLSQTITTPQHTPPNTHPTKKSYNNSSNHPSSHLIPYTTNNSTISNNLIYPHTFPPPPNPPPLIKLLFSPLTHNPHTTPPHIPS